MEALSRRDYSRLWNTNDALLSAICFLHLPSILFLPLFPLTIYLSLSLPLSLFLSSDVQLSLHPPLKTNYSLSYPAPSRPPHSVKHCILAHHQTHSQRHTTHTHFSAQFSSPFPPSNLLSRSLTQSYFSMVAFVPFISAKTKDSCAYRTEGRRGLKGRTQRKRS